MITIEALKSYGANTQEGLTRCMNNEEFYIMIVNKTLEDNRLGQLEQQINNGDLEAAFETAHALKGVYSNLSLDPLTKPISEITELLRVRSDADYSSLIADAKEQFSLLISL